MDDSNREMTISFHWREHANRLTEGLADMFRRGCQVDTDVIPSSNWPGHLRVHRLVLSALLSPKVIDDQTATLDLNNLANSTDDVQSLIEFIYTGRLTVRKERLEPMRRLAIALQFHDLSNIMASEDIKPSAMDINFTSIIMSVKQEVDINRFEEPSRTPEPKDIKNIKTLLSDLVDGSSAADHNSPHAPIRQAPSRESCKSTEQLSSSIVNESPSTTKIDESHETDDNRPTTDKPLDDFYDQGDFSTSKGVELERHDVDHHDTDSSTSTVSFLAEEVQEKRFKCEQCCKSFTLRNNLRRHIRKTHEGNAAADQSLWIRKQLFRKKSLEGKTLLRRQQQSGGLNRRTRNLRGNPKEKQFFCKHCTDSFTLQAFLEIHVKKKHKITLSEEKKPFSCDRCPKSFMHKSSLDFHVKKKHKLNNGALIMPKRFPCELCSKSFTRRFTLKFHLKDVHQVPQSSSNATQNPFVCDQCPKTFDLNSSLKRHVTMVHAKEFVKQMSVKTAENNPRPFQCQQCPKKFKNKASLTFHVKQKHQVDDQPCPSSALGSYPQRSRRCGHCNMTLGNMSEYRHHLHKDHPTLDVIECSRCDFATTSKAYLYQHAVNKHNRGRRRLKCPHCPLKCKTKDSLTVHVRFKHQDENISLKQCENSIEDKLEKKNAEYQENDDDDADDDHDVEMADQLQDDSSIDNSLHSDLTNELPAVKHNSVDVEQVTGDEHVHLKEISRDVQIGVADGGGGITYPNVLHSCMLCSFRFDTHLALRCHLSRDHPDIKVFQCKRCAFYTIQERRMEDHRCRKNYY